MYVLCSVAAVEIDEVCQMETFHAKCPADHVIVIESAQLGRLKIGIHTRVFLYLPLLLTMYTFVLLYLYIFGESNDDDNDNKS